MKTEYFMHQEDDMFVVYKWVSFTSGIILDARSVVRTTSKEAAEAAYRLLAGSEARS